MNTNATETVKSAANVRYLDFSLGEEEYAIPLLTVKEVIAMPEITPIPHTPSYFLGITNLRGQVISIIDLRTKMGIKPTNSSEMAVIICDLGSINLGVVVDSVNSVLTPKEEDLSGRPDIQSNKNTDFVTAVYRKEKRLVLILDLAKSLDLKDYQMITQAQQKTA